MRSNLPMLAAAAVLFACSGSRNLDVNRALDTERDDGGEQDARDDDDAGAAEDEEDASPPDEGAPDAALDMDAGEQGEPDAGARDAGVSQDAGPSADAAADAGTRALAVVGQPFVAGTSGTACGIAYDSQRDSLWVYPCSGATVQQFSRAGAALSSVARPGESADDVDVDFAPASFTLAGASVGAGDMLFINGESGPAEVYVVSPDTDAGTSRTLASQFGASHVVGGAYHIARGTFFAVQDRVPGATVGNQVAEIDATTGAVLRSFSTLPNFDVNYGDLEVCQSTGNLLFVSSAESTLGEFTPEGVFVAEHPLPSGVSGLSGIGLDDATGTAWLSSTSRNVFQVSGVPCPNYVR